MEIGIRDHIWEQGYGKRVPEENPTEKSLRSSFQILTIEK